MIGLTMIFVSHLFGPHTEKALKNFPISGWTMPEEFLRALAMIKEHAAIVNGELGEIPKAHARAIAKAAREIRQGKHMDQFPVDVFQTGSGTSTNMNMNEVIAGLGNARMKGMKGRKSKKGCGIHPNDDVNRCQSSNDVIPTALHIAILLSIRDGLMPALTHFENALHEKSLEFHSIIKSGRTHLMDAVPVRLGDEFASYVELIEQVYTPLLLMSAGFHELPLGGTAVGTGLNAHPQFAKKVIMRISRETGMQFKEAGYVSALARGATAPRIAMQSCPLWILRCSSHLRELAVVLEKIANDIRLMGAFGELILPPLQAGSSIMPGKVNPVLCESVMQVASWVIGADASVAHAIAMESRFELCTAYPLLAEKLLPSIRILSNVSRVFADKCIKGITANTQRISDQLSRNSMIATALANEIGYDQAAAIVKESMMTDETILEVSLRRTSLGRKKLEALLRPSGMV